MSAYKSAAISTTDQLSYTRLDKINFDNAQQANLYSPFEDPKMLPYSGSTLPHLNCLGIT
jgi:hypothetical protein